jgi:hypothetical protein
MYGATYYGGTLYADTEPPIGGGAEGIVIAVLKCDPPPSIDLALIGGDTFNATLLFFSDLRVKQWRGEWHEYFVYEIGEAVETEPGEMFVAVARTMQAKPGEPGSEEFWSPLTPMDLTDTTVELVCEDLLALTEGHGITVTPESGRVAVEVTPAQSEVDTTSGSYYIRFTEGVVISTAVRGTMLFHQP